ncbi:MAG: Exonuclease SbcD [Clostridiales bacterium 38_11]|nr:MAG: Exonuclease SbcD [Clostridiales bacterium 38_11]HBH13165.1 DNA repair exonuclease [Clostridiales bacterium]
MNISFIHTADLHIGKKFNVNFNSGEGKKRRREIWETFDKIIEVCIRNNIGFLLIAGDLVDAKYCTFDDMKRLSSKFSEAKNTEIIITTGNRDPYTNYSLYRFIDWSDNVHIVDTTDQIKKIGFKDKSLCIFSVGLDTKEKQNERTCLYNIEVDPSDINILLVHGDIFDNDTADVRIDIKKIENLFDYVALGHVHQYTEYSEKVIYPGTPEPLDFSEKGQHGIVFCKLNKSNLEKVFVPTAKSRFITKEIFLQPDFNYEKILDIIKFSGDYISASKDYYRIVLTGKVDMAIDMNRLKSEASSFFQYIEFVDDYLYQIDYDYWIEENSDNIVGQYFKQFKASETENLDRQKSLLLGLGVLLGEKENDR